MQTPVTICCPALQCLLYAIPLLELLIMFPTQAAVKQQLLLSPSTNYRGYQPLGLNVTLHDQGLTPDWHEALDYYKEEDPKAVEVSSAAAAAITCKGVATARHGALQGCNAAACKQGIHEK